MLDSCQVHLLCIVEFYNAPLRSSDHIYNVSSYYKAASIKKHLHKIQQKENAEKKEAHSNINS